VTNQHLTGKLPKRPTRDEIVSLIRDLPYVQWDPVTIVAPSHMISLWSRLGRFDPSDLEGLLWDDRRVFLHWTPIASLVLAEDYPLYASLMKRYPGSMASWGIHGRRAVQFLANHKELRLRMLTELRKGPLQANQFSDYAIRKSEHGWSSENEISNLLYHLHMSGEVMVVGRRGNQNVWGLTDEFLPRWVEREPLGEDEFEREAAQRALRGLGTATPSEIKYYFPPGRYQNLKKALASLEEESLIHPVSVDGFGKKNEVRYVHDRDLPLLETIGSDAWDPRVSLIAPFDTLIRGQARTNAVFGFDYVHEQFLPKEKRKFGTYVLPILLGANLIGRADLKMDREKETLLVNSVHSERGAPTDRAVGSEIAERLGELAEFLGAKEVVYTPKVPGAWKVPLR
jgi:uncharacterized protein